MLICFAKEIKGCEASFSSKHNCLEMGLAGDGFGGGSKFKSSSVPFRPSALFFSKNANFFYLPFAKNW